MLCERDIILLNEDGSVDDPNLTMLVGAPITSINKQGSQNEHSNEELSSSKRGMINNSIFAVNRRSSKNNKKMRKKKNPFNKYLEKSDIVEIAIRAPKISDSGELKVITILFDQLAVPTNETVKLYKLLIYYEQIQTFEMLLKYRMKEGVNTQNARPKSSESRRNLRRKTLFGEGILGRKDDDNVYDFEEIISDAFSYSISINKLHISFYLFKTYEDDVYENKMECIKSILNSFKNDHTQSNQVMYLEERIFILEKFMQFIEYNLALEFLTVIHQEISDDPSINFLVYCPNPLKIIVMLLNIVINVSKKHKNLEFKAQKVRSSL